MRTDHGIGARRLDLVIIDKRDKSCQIIDVAILDDGRVREKEDESAHLSLKTILSPLDYNHICSVIEASTAVPASLKRSSIT